MDAPDNPYGRRTNELAAQRLHCYRGCAIVGFNHLKFETNTTLGGRQLDEGNVDRLLKIFEIVVAILSQNTESPP
jgi:hypothetical protein